MPGVAEGQSWRLAEQLRLDGSDHELSSISWVDAFRDGTIVVAQPQDQRLLFFSPDGRLTGSFGRKGAGPGEYATLAWSHGMTGDTLWTVDGSLDRYTLIDTRARAVRSLPLPRPLHLPGYGDLPFGLTYPQGFSARGILLYANAPPAAPLPSRWRAIIGSDQGVLFWATASGQIGALVASLPTRQQVCGTDLARQRECDEPLYAVGTDAGIVVTVTPMITAAGEGRLLVSGVDADGRQVLSVPHPYTPERISDHTTDSLRAAMVRAAQSSRSREYWQRASFPLHRRAIDRLLIGKDGRIWIGWHSEPGRHKRWWVLGARGDRVAELVAPPRVELTAVGSDAAWGYAADPDGVESVVRYRILRNP